MVRIVTVLLAALVALTGPGRAAPSRDRAPSCPEVLHRVVLARAVVDGGVALTFTTPIAEHVAPLRELLRAAAHALEEHTNVRQLRRDPNSMLAKLPPLRVRVRSVGAGARVTIRTARAADVLALRRTAIELEHYWRANECVNGKQPDVAKRPRASARSGGRGGGAAGSRVR